MEHKERISTVDVILQGNNERTDNNQAHQRKCFTFHEVDFTGDLLRTTSHINDYREELAEEFCMKLQQRRNNSERKSVKSTCRLICLQIKIFSGRFLVKYF